MSAEKKEELTLNTKQKYAYKLMMEGKSVFVTGAGGCGKTELLKKFIKDTPCQNIGVTSTTGISALTFGGRTLHSFTGIGLGTGSAGALAMKIMKKSYIRIRWRKLEILVIDEVSMLSLELFEKLEDIARRVRGNELPFGGIQLILSGDYLQLPPVKSDKFCFESEKWDKCISNTVYLTEIIRQEDNDFKKCLNEIRMGNVSKETRKLLDTRIGVELKNDFGIKPTKFFSTNYMADEINEKEIQNLEDDLYEYEMEIEIFERKNRDFALEKIKKNCQAPKVLYLCEGCQVMLLHNLDIDSGLVNGSRGVVTKFVEDIPIVKFLNGMEIPIGYHIWEYEENDTKIGSITQIPLKLAWGFTIHKCISENTLIYTEQGIKRIKKLSHDLYPEQKSMETKQISLGIIGKTGMNEATQIYKGKIEDTYIITTSLGYHIECSSRHPILTYNGEEEWKKAPDIRIDDYLTLKLGSECFGKNIPTKSFNCDDMLVCYKIPKVVDEKLCYIIGLLIGDGFYSTKKHYPVELVVHKYIKETYEKYFYELFGRKCSIYDYPKRNMWKFMVNSKHIRDFLEWCGLGYDVSYNKKIPWVVLENTRESQINCIRGLFDTDGGINNSCVHFTTTSFMLATDVHNVLLNLGIISSLREMKGKSREKYRQAYRIHITGYQAHLYYKIIGFFDTRKQEKLYEKYGEYKLHSIKSNICEIPNGDSLIKHFRNEIYDFYGVEKRCDYLPYHYRKILTNIINGKSKLRFHHLEKLCTELEILTEEIGEAGKKLNYMYKNGLFFDKVVKIEKSKKQLYDLYIPNEHTFIGNGIVNHNCQSLTLDYVEVNLSNCFTYGQAYVALSRVRSLEGLSIIDIDYERITAHPVAIDFYRKLDSTSSTSEEDEKKNK